MDEEIHSFGLNFKNTRDAMNTLYRRVSGTSHEKGITAAFQSDHNEHLVFLQMCVVSLVAQLGDSVMKVKTIGAYLCNADCIMLIRSTIILQRKRGASLLGLTLK